MRAISDNINRADIVIVAGEAVDLIVSGPQLSLIAAKLLHLLVDASGVDVCEPIRHQMHIDTLNDHFRLSIADFVTAATELITCSVQLRRMTLKGRRTFKAGPLLQHVQHDRDDNTVDPASGPALLSWEFSSVAREMLSDSNYWASLSRRAILAIEGRYSLRLYEMIALRAGLDRKEETLTVDQLRQRLGVPVGNLKTWSDLRVRALDPAVREVRQLSGLDVSYTPILKGKVAVVGIILRWNQASRESRAAAVRELEGSRVGRKARRAATVEQIVESAPAIEPIRFPADGDIRETVFERIARASLPPPIKDLDLVGREFVRWAHAGNRPLVGEKVTAMFASYCSKQGEVK